MSIRIAVRGIIVDNGKLLCFKLKPYGGRDQTDFWCTPGGAIEPGESIQDALRREMLEEAGVEPVVGNLLYVQQYRRKDLDKSEEIEFFFHIKNPADYRHIDLNKTTHGEEEIAEFDFIDAAKNNVKPVFLTTENLTQIDENKPAKIFSYL